MSVIVTGNGQGPAGPPGVDLTYEQSFAGMDIVVVHHNLGKHPSVTVVTSAGDEVLGDVHYTDLNSLTVSFAAAMGGTIICN